MAIIPTGCGVSLDLTDSLTKVDDMINDILNGIGDATGAIADAVAAALGNLEVSLGKMLPDISGLIPDISFQAGIEALLGFVKGTLEYAAKLAELVLQFGEAILGAGLNIFDLIADAAAGLLKGFDPCSLIPEFKKGANGAITKTPNNVGNAKKEAVYEPKPDGSTLTRVTKSVSLSVSLQAANEASKSKKVSFIQSPFSIFKKKLVQKIESH